MYQNCTNVEGVLAHSQKSSEQLVRFLTVLVKNGGVPPTLQNVPSAFWVSFGTLVKHTMRLIWGNQKWPPFWVFFCAENKAESTLLVKFFLAKSCAKNKSCQMVNEESMWNFRLMGKKPGNLSIFSIDARHPCRLVVPISQPNFFPMGNGKCEKWLNFPWEFLGKFQKFQNYLNYWILGVNWWIQSS